MTALTNARRRLLISTALVAGAALTLPLGIQPAHAQTYTTAVDVDSTADDNDRSGGGPTNPNITDVLGGVQVDLNSRKTVINWNFFSVDTGKFINFTDLTGFAPGTVVSVFNRVVGTEASTINGTISSSPNVVVWISNPNGITFGGGGIFSGGSLVLTTADFDGNNLNQKNNKFFNAGGATAYELVGASGAAISLNATSEITTAGLFAAVGQDISASGKITATGEVALIAAQDIDLTLNPGSPIGYTIKKGTAVGTAKLKADGTIDASSITITGAGRRTAGSESDLLLEIGNSLTATAAGGKIFIGLARDAGDEDIGGDGDAMQLVANTTLKGDTVEIASNLNSDTTARSLTITGNAKLGGTLGATRALSSLLISGTTQFDATGTSLAPSVNTTGTQEYQGAVTLNGNTLLKGSSVTFGSTIDGAKSLEVQGNAVFKGLVGDSTALTSTKVTGTTDFRAAGTSLSPSVTTTGTQAYDGAVTLTDNTVLKGSTVTFGSTVDGAKLLEVQGNAVLKGIVGGTTALTSVDISGTTDFQAAGTLLAPSVTTTGTQAYRGGGTLSADTVLKGGTITLGDTINDTAFDGAKSLAIVGDAVIHADLGTNTALTSLSVSGTTQIDAATDDFDNKVTIKTSGTQDYTGAVSLLTDASLEGSTITFNNTVNGANDLAVDGDAVFKNIVGGTTALASVSVSGTTDFQATGTSGSPSVTTTGTQEYTGIVTLTGDTVLKGSTVTFGGAVDGNKLLEVQGDAEFNGVVGANTALTSVLVTGKTLFNAAGTVITPTVTTSGAQEYQGAVTLDDDTFLKGTTVTFGSTIDGGNALQILGNAVFKGIVGGNDELDSVLVTGTTDFQATGTTAIPSVSTSGTQEYQGTVTLTGDTVLKGSTVTFGSTVDGAKLLEVQGNAVFNGIVGGTTALTSAKVTKKATFNAAGTTAIPSVTTTGAQDYEGGADLGAATVLKGTTVTFGKAGSASAVNGANSLLIDGNAVLRSNFGTTTALTSLTVNGTTTFNAPFAGGKVTVKTSGVQDYKDTVTLSSDADLEGSTITFDKTVDGANDLKIIGDAVLKGIVGGTTALATLEVTKKTSFQAAGTTVTPSVTTTGTQKYTGDATLAVDTVLKGSGVTFEAKVDGTTAQTELLEIIGSAAFTGKVGSTVELESLKVSGGSSVTADDSIKAHKFISLAATGPVSVKTLTTTDTTAGSGDITINATGAAEVAGDVTATGNYSVTGGSVKLGDNSIRTQTAAGSVTIKATTGDVTKGVAALTIQSDNTGLGGRSLSITSDNGSVSLANTVVTGGTMTGTGPIVHGMQSDVTVTAKQNVTLAEAHGATTTITATNGDATVGTANATGAVNVSAGNAASVNSSAGGSITVSGGSASLGTGNSGSFIKVLAGTGTATLGTGDAGTDILVQSTGNDASIGNATSTNSSVTLLANKKATVSGNVSAGTDYIVTGGTGVVLGNASSDVTQSAKGAVTITATTGDVAQASNLRTVTLQSNSDGGGGEALTVRANAGSVNLTNAHLVGGVLMSGNVIKLSDVLVEARDDAKVDQASGRNVTVRATNGLAELRRGFADQSVLVKSINDNATLGTATADNGSVTVEAGKIATVTGDVTAKTSYTVTGDTGVMLGNNTAAAKQSAGGAVTITATTGNVSQGTALLTLQSNSDGVGTEALTVRAPDGSVNLTNAVLTGGTMTGSSPIVHGKQSDVLVEAKTDAKVMEAHGLNVTVRATNGVAELDTGRAANSVLVKSTNDNATLGTATADNGSITVEAGKLATVLRDTTAKTSYTVTGGTGVALGNNTAAAKQSAGGAVTITATTGNVSQGSQLLTLQSNSDGVGAEALTVRAPDGSVNLTNAVLTGGTMTGTGPIVHGKQSDVLVEAKADAKVTEAHGLNVTVRATNGVAEVGTARAANAVLVKSTNDNATLGNGSTDLGAITVEAGKIASVTGDISAKTTYNVTGATGVVLGDANTRTQTTGGSVNIVATTGNVTKGSGVLTLRADSDGSGGDTLTVRALTGDITLAGSTLQGGAGRQSDVAIDAAGNASLNVVDGRDITVTSNRIALGGAVTGGRTVTLINRASLADGSAATNNTFIGATGDENTQYVLSAAEIANVTGPKIQVITQQRAGGTQNVTLGSFVLKSGTTNFGILTEGVTNDAAKIELVGKITGDAFNGTLQIGGNNTASAKTNYIVAKIDTTDGAEINLPNGTVDLRANRIVFANASVRDDPLLAAASPDITAINRDLVSSAFSSLYVPLKGGGTITSNPFLTAKSMKVSYTNFALFQNIGTPGNPKGVVLGGTAPNLSQTSPTLELNAGVGGTNAFAMFGTINGFIGRTAGLLPESVILYSQGSGTARQVLITQSNSRINGCVIGSPDKGCLITDVQPPALRLFDERQVQVFTTGDEDSRVVLDPLVGTNNEALLGDLAVPTLNYDLPECDPASDQTCDKGKN